MKRKKRIVDRGEAPHETYPFPLMSKGEREKKGMEIERNNKCMKIGGSMVIGGAMITGGA
jgi:hypothetical protein